MGFGVPWLPASGTTCRKAPLLEALKKLSLTPKCVPRKELQALIGRLVWFTSGARWLRPWLQLLFHAPNKPSLRFQALDSLQIGELAGKLSSTGPSFCRCAGHAVCETNTWESMGEIWRARAIPHLPFQRRNWCRPLLVDHSEAAGPYLSGGGPWSSLRGSCWCVCWKRPLRLWRVVSLSGETLAAENIWWFSVQLTASDLPGWFHWREGPARGDCSLRSPGSVGVIGMPAAPSGCVCDNGATIWVWWLPRKGLSLKQPLAGVLQSIALFAAKHHLNLCLSHVAGERNEWADCLTRAFPVHGLDQSKRLQPDWLALLKFPASCIEAVACAWFGGFELHSIAWCATLHWGVTWGCSAAAAAASPMGGQHASKRCAGWGRNWVKVRCFLFSIAEARNSFKFESVFWFQSSIFLRFFCFRPALCEYLSQLWLSWCLNFSFKTETQYGDLACKFGGKPECESVEVRLLLWPDGVTNRPDTVYVCAWEERWHGEETLFLVFAFYLEPKNTSHTWRLSCFWPAEKDFEN